MATEISETEVLTFSAEPGIRFEVEYSTNSFRPNRVSESFAKAIPKNLDGLIIDDIGSGGGVLAITEAKRGAKEVRAVEPADANYKLLLRNIERNNHTGQIFPFQGVYFDLIAHLPPADIISADVSGIPEVFARAMGWYPEGVPTGGTKGSEITCELLRRAPYYIKPDGRLYFPTADDLLDTEEILNVAREKFTIVKNALCTLDELEAWKEKAAASNGREWRSPEYVWFNLTEKNIRTLEERYGGRIPDTIHIQEVRGKYFWRGRIHVAMEPKV